MIDGTLYFHFQTGLGLLGAAPAELQQGYGGGAGMGQGSQQGFGGGGGMGQYGMGPRSLMGNNSQFQGNTGQMGGGKGHGHDQLTIDIVCLLIVSRYMKVVKV